MFALKFVCWVIAASAPAGCSAASNDPLLRPASESVVSTNAALLRITRAGQRLVAVGERGIILLSDDSGAHWRQAVVPVSTTLTGVQFTSAKRGWAIGHSSVVLRTDDAGDTWTTVLDGRGAVKLLESRAATLSAESDQNPTTVRRAVEIAKQFADDGPDKPLLDLSFSDDGHGIVVGAYGSAYLTADGGQTWQSVTDAIPNPKGLHLYSVTRQRGKIYWAGEQGLLIESDDSARTFVKLDGPYRGTYFVAVALEDGAVLLLGMRGNGFRHEVDGTFQTIRTGSTYSANSVTQLDPRHWLLVTQNGPLLVGDRAARVFMQTGSVDATSFVSVAVAPDGSWVGVGMNGVSRLPSTSATKVQTEARQ